MAQSTGAVDGDHRQHFHAGGGRHGHRQGPRGGEQRLTRDGQFTDRCTAAVTKLGSNAEEVWIGGMYALQRLAHDSPRDAPSVVQVLAAYVRSHTADADEGGKGTSRPANDVAAALAILVSPLAKGVPLDLHGAYLSGADLSGADMAGANLTDADLTDAVLGNADLTRADLSGTILVGVKR